jgi:hypothetical protein
MPRKVGLRLLVLLVVLLLGTAAGNGATNHARATVQKGEIPAWMLHGHMKVTSAGGGFETMPADLRQMLSRRLATTQIIAPCTPKWVGKTYTWWSFWKHFHVTVVLWTVTEKAAYCTDGSNVTFFYRMRSYKIPSLPVFNLVTRVNPWTFMEWQDDGYDCPGIATGDDDHCYDPKAIVQTRISIAKAYFDICVVKGVCLNPQYPWVGIRVDGNGYVAKESGNG